MEVIQQLVNGLTLGVIYTLIAIGLTIIFGILRVGNFAQGEFYMVGAYVGSYVVSYLYPNYPLAILLSIGAVAILGIVVERLVVRPLQGRPGMPLIVSTLGASVFLANIALFVFGPNPRKIDSPYVSKQVVIAGIYLTQQRILIVVIGVLVIILINLFIKYTKTGMSMRAIAKDPDTAALMGINVNRIYAFTFAFGAGLASLAGTLVGPIFTIETNMGALVVMKAFAVVIMGGMGNVPGAIFGGFILGVAESLGAGFISTGYKDAIGFGIMILVLLFRPQGLFGREGLH